MFKGIFEDFVYHICADDIKLIFDLIRDFREIFFIQVNTQGGQGSKSDCPQTLSEGFSSFLQIFISVARRQE